MAEAKPWWKSKTMWANIAIGVAAAVTELAPLADVMQPEQAASFRSVLLVVGVLANLLLRIVTTGPVTR